MRILLLLFALLFFCNSFTARAETPAVAISFAFDMSWSTHDRIIDRLTPADLQVVALRSAFEILAEQDLTCAVPFQMQVIFWGSLPTVALPWLYVPNTKRGYQAAARTVGALHTKSYYGTNHARMQHYLEMQLQRSGSRYQLGVITANEGAAPSVVDVLAAEASNSSTQLYGASINDGGTLFYLEAVTKQHVLVRSHDELRDWFVELLRTAVAPRLCTVS